MRQLLSVIVSMFLAATAAAAVPAVDFEARTQWQIVHADRVGASFDVVRGERAEQRVGRLQWSSTHGRAVELHMVRPVVLAGFREKLDGGMRVRLSSPGTAGVASMALRLRDDQGEVFQWRKPVDLRRAGVRDVEYELSPDGFHSSWNTRGERTGVPRPPMSLVGVALELAGDAPAGWVDFVDVAYTRADLPLAELVRVGVETGRPLNVLTPDDPPALTLTLENRGAEPLALTIEATLESFRGEVQTHAQDVTLQPESVGRWTPPIELRGSGVWWVAYRLRERGTDRVYDGWTSVARMKPAGPILDEPAEFRFGVNSHATRYGERVQRLEAAAAGLVGAKLMRHGVSWDRLQPEPGVWAWETMDRFLDLLTAQGVELQFVMGFTPRWASTAPEGETRYSIWSRMPPRLDVWESYARALMGRYHGRVRYWETWNEPDLDFFRGSVDDMLTMAEVAHRVAEEIDPSLVMLSPGFSSRTDNAAFTEEFIRRGADRFDVLAWHQHGTFESLRGILDDRVGGLRTRYIPGKPLLMNESGFAVSDTTPASQRRQAEAMVKKMTWVWSRGAIGHVWYQLRDELRADSSVESSFGMLAPDFAPKAPYVTFNTLTSLLTDKRYLSELDLGPSNTGLLFGNEVEQVVVAWSDGGVSEQRSLTTDAAGAQRVDLMGNAEPLPILGGGQLVVEVSPTPGFVVLTGATRRAEAGRAVLRPVTTTLLPGRRNDVAFDVTNPTAAEVEITLTLQMPDGLGGGVVERRQSVAAGQTRRVTLPVDVPAAAGRGSPRQREAVVNYAADGGGVSGRMAVVFDLGTRIMGGVEGRGPDFELRDAASVVNLFPDDPYQVHKQWKGADDLGVRAWLAAEDGALRLRLDVTDDVYHAAEDAAAPWQGDSVQLALQSPDARGHWEFTIARLADGQPVVRCSIRPDGAADAAAAVEATTTLREGGMRYDVRLPLTALELDRARLEAGVRLSFLVNDNDGHGREGWVELSPGIGSVKDPARFPVVVLPGE